jgi:hypothetical protein
VGLFVGPSTAHCRKLRLGYHTKLKISGEELSKDPKLLTNLFKIFDVNSECIFMNKVV